MITLWIDWCARNRFLVFTGTFVLLLAGLWTMRRIPLDALPDLSDVQVIIHTPWNGEPPNIIEDQVTYPIVTALLAAPHVKAVRAQTMFGDSYVFVVFEDGTDLYWARARVLEYLQQIGGRLPAAVHPAIGPDATGAGWVYEYLIVDLYAQLKSCGWCPWSPWRGNPPKTRWWFRRGTIRRAWHSIRSVF